MATPFAGKAFTFRNPDGSEVAVLGWGNQLSAAFESTDGYTVVRDPVNGFYEYASHAPDGSLMGSGLRVGAGDPRARGLNAHLRAAAPARRRQRVSGGVVPNRWEVRRQERRAGLDAPPGGAPRSAPSRTAPTGDVLGLCVMVDFPDEAGTITRDEVDDFCNKAGYTGFGNNGSVFDFFHDMSAGRLSYRNVVVGYHTANRKRSFYDNPDHDMTVGAKLLATEALDALKASGFDFDQLTADGRANRGSVYALNIFYAGTQSTVFRKGLWPHQFNLGIGYDITANQPPPLPGIPPPTPLRSIVDYQITNIGSELTLRTFCHENGHMLCDFPDLYDTDAAPHGSSGAGDYCLMAYAGTAGHSAAEKNPTQVSGYLKNAAGWSTDVRTVTNGDVASIAPGRSDLLIHRKNGNEYFLLENRPRQARDANLPVGGLLIWHVDEHGSNNNQDMTAASHYELSLEQADGRFDLEHAANFGDLGDAFGPSSKFGDLTVPDSKWWDGTRSSLDIDSIAIDPSTSDVTVTTKGSGRQLSQPNGRVTVVGSAAGRADLFTVSADQRVMWTHGAPLMGWSAWSQVNQGTVSRGSAVTAVSRMAGQIDVFVVGSDGHAWTIETDPATGWTDWRQIGSVTMRPGSVISAVSRTPDSMDLVGVRDDNAVIAAFFLAGEGWSDWSLVNGGATGPGAEVTATARNANVFDVFTVGGDGQVWTIRWDHHAGFGAWSALPGVVGATVITSEVTKTPGHTDLFTVAGDGRVMSTHKDESTGWATDWFHVSDGMARPGALVTAITRPGIGDLDLFTVAPDGRMMSTWWNVTDGWANWFQVSGGTSAPAAHLTAITSTADHMDVFGIGVDNAVWNTWWDAAGGWQSGWTLVT